MKSNIYNSFKILKLLNLNSNINVKKGNQKIPPAVGLEPTISSLGGKRLIH